MQILKTISCFVTIIVCAQYTYCQSLRPAAPFNNGLLFNTMEFIKTDSGLFINHYSVKTCKFFSIETDFIPANLRTIIPSAPVVKVHEEFRKPQLITVHGNVLYNFSYRSYIDTPFAQQDVIQHLVQTNFNFVFKEKYPVRVTLTNRSSNSPYFANSTDVTLQFNQRQLLDNIKTNLKTKVNTLVDVRRLSEVEQLYKSRQLEVQKLQTWINSPARVQEMVEEKEGRMRGSLRQVSSGVSDSALSGFNEKGALSPDLLQVKGKFRNTKQQIFENLKARGEIIEDSIKRKVKDTMQSVLAKQKTKTDSSSSVMEKIKQKRQELAKLKAELQKDAAKVKQTKKSITDSISKLNTEINNLSSANGLYAFMHQNNIAKDELTKAQRILLAVNQVGIGRSFVDYSELTVKNVSISGINIEVNPGKIYLAAAAGKLNYRFRDFIVKNGNSNSPNQSLYLVRAGIGQKEKNNFILSFYNGKKSILNNTNGPGPYALQRVLGISAEARFALNENNYIVAEVAKSSFNNNSSLQLSSSDLMSKAINFKLRTNEAYCIKLYSDHPQTNTRFTGYYKKIGENFQSFNLNPIHINQDAWMARLSQQFWKRRIMLDASIRKNDFNSPIAAPSFSTQTIFKAIQVSIRVPKYPFVSIGYYPSSQLSLSNNNVLVESQYNTLNSVMSYSYRYKKLGMNTNAMYTKFYNSSTDTGFIYFNATNFTINHSIFFSGLTLQTSLALTNQKDIDLFSAEEMFSYQFKRYLTVGGAVKWNRVNYEQTLMGGTASMSLYINKIGTIQINYDKTYLPAYDRRLLAVDMGRLTFYREF